MIKPLIPLVQILKSNHPSLTPSQKKLELGTLVKQLEAKLHQKVPSIQLNLTNKNNQQIINISGLLDDEYDFSFQISIHPDKKPGFSVISLVPTIPCFAFDPNEIGDQIAQTRTLAYEQITQGIFEMIDAHLAITRPVGCLEEAQINDGNIENLTASAKYAIISNQLVPNADLRETVSDYISEEAQIPSSTVLARTSRLFTDDYSSEDRTRTLSPDYYRGLSEVLQQKGVRNFFK